MKSNRKTSSDGKLTHDGTIGKLYQTSQKIATAEARLWLIKQLLLNRLATRDIYHFAVKQADLRLMNKDPDPLTIRVSMLAKERDIKTSINQRSSMLNECLEVKKYTLMNLERLW